MTFTEAHDTFEELFTGKLKENDAKALLEDLYIRGESADEIAAAAEVMRSHAIKLDVPEHLKSKLFDNCGTGGDKSGSFNISTTVSIILASMGLVVAKHGNRSITSKSGSADVLESLGVKLNLNSSEQITMLEETGFAFLFAQNHHPAMKYIMPIRKSISHRTIFNILGPLTSPANVKNQLIGVFDPSYVLKIAEALKILGSSNTMVVSSLEGLDEIGIGSISKYAKLENGKITEGEIEPEKFSIKRASLDDIKGGDSIQNAKIMKDVLSANSKGAKEDIVCLNAAAAFEVSSLARDMQDGLDMARESIYSGKANVQLEKIIKVSQSL